MFTLPPQQILQANGKESIDMIRMSPNSSVLIADTTRPIIWKCVSDGLGNVTAEAWDITRHKSEEQIERETTTQLLQDINSRLKKLEENYESTIGKCNESAGKTTYANSTNGSKSANGYGSSDKK